MASSATVQAHAAPAAAPSTDSSTVPNNAGVEREQRVPRRSGIARRSIGLATYLPRKIGRLALGLLKSSSSKPSEQFGGLKDVVSYSSRRMAAGRALEFELGRERGALFLDPLAAALAGPSAIEDARKWSRACSTAANAIADALASGKRPPTKQELVDLVQEREAKNNKGSNFTIGAPLTLVALAGRSIHRGRVDASYSASVPTCPAENSISLVTARHRWFDSAIMEALAGEGCGVEVVISPSATSDASKNDKGSGSSSVRVEIRPRRRRGEKGEEEITQVVLLGAGMDARAWRLPLPAGNGVSWFDLDSGPVCEIKRRELESAGAELLRREEEGEGKGREEASTSPPAIPPPPRFPLKPRSYSLVGCDMASAGEWVAKLKGAGFDPERPAVFAAEGLIYYLGAKAPDFMRALQSIAAPGSVFLLDALDEQGVASAVKKAEGKGLQGQFSFGVPDADSGSELADFFASFGFDRVVSADTWSVLRARFQREAYPLRCFTKDKPSCGKAEGGIRFLVVAKGV